MASKQGKSSKATPKSKKLSDADLEKASGGAARGVARKPTPSAVRGTKTTKRNPFIGTIR